MKKDEKCSSKCLRIIVEREEDNPNQVRRNRRRAGIRQEIQPRSVNQEIQSRDEWFGKYKSALG
jgi:hypothetical protein